MDYYYYITVFNYSLSFILVLHLVSVKYLINSISMLMVDLQYYIHTLTLRFRCRFGLCNNNVTFRCMHDVARHRWSVPTHVLNHWTLTFHCIVASSLLPALRLNFCEPLSSERTFFLRNYKGTARVKKHFENFVCRMN